MDSLQRLIDEAESLETTDIRAAYNKYCSVVEMLIEMTKKEKTARSRTKVRDKALWFIEYCEKLKPKLPQKMTPTAVEEDFGYKDIIGLEEPKRVLANCTKYVDAHPELYVNVEVPKRILLYGPPGTGKTMLAKALAAESKRQFLAPKASDIMSKWVGESESRMKDLFDQARSCKSVIFFDEIDSFCGIRNDQETDGNRRLKNELLTQIQGVSKTSLFEPIILGATNVPWLIDPAFLRRFQTRIYIPLPTLDDRKQLLMHYLPYVPLSIHEVTAIAEKMEGCSGSDIHNFCQQVGMRPIQRVHEAKQFILVDDKYHVYTKEDFPNPEGVVLDMNFINVPAGCLALPEVKFDDFINCLAQLKPSLTTETLKKYEEWEKYGVFQT